MSTFQQVGLHLDPGRLRVLIEAGQAATTQRELEDVLERLLATARELTGAQLAAIKVIGDHADDVEPGVTAQTAGRPTEHGESIDVAILIDDEAWGYLWLAFDRIDGPEFRIEDERLLLAAAASASTAVATAQSLQRERLRRSLAAAEEERRRWARELHDETLQALGGLRVMLSSARRSTDVMALHATLETAVDRLAEEIAGLRELITDASNSARRIALTLREARRDAARSRCTIRWI